MKPRSIAVALAFCVFLLSTSSYAQQMPKARQQRLMALAKQLDLTRKQAKQLFPIMQAQEPQLQAIRNDPSLSRVEKLKRFHAVQDASDPQVKAILTPAQFQQLQAIRRKRRAELLQAAQSHAHQGGAARSSAGAQQK
jgi:Spy/CpxP family protein refolding chaperone